MSRAHPVIGITTDIQANELHDERFVIETTYARAITKAGGIPIFLPSLPQYGIFLRNATARIDGLLLPGGRDMDPKYFKEEPHPKLRLMRPERVESEMIILDQALKERLPTLGICGGMQLINVFCGGSLYQDISSLIPHALPHEKGAIHEIHVRETSLLEEVVKEKQFSAKSYHHQAVKALGSGLTMSATSPDGVIEAIEKEGHFVLGVQWHPEREDDPISTRIFGAFVAECAKEQKG